MVCRTEVFKFFNIGIAFFMVLVCATDGLPYGPLPPEAGAGFSFQSFKEFVLGEFPSDKHTHDPAEKYMHKGQEPSVAEVAIAQSHDQPVAERVNDGTDGDQNAEQEIAQARVMDDDDDEYDDDDDDYDDDDVNAQDVNEDDDLIQQEPIEELDVPHEHPEAEYKGIMEDIAEQTVVKDVTLKEEI
ncbi:hypothetical protein BSL78_00069 [Apostichopus japonicus]|uniref:Uncharacterized protein n=1 Tax=Stichopus japonicus TaxID=307972 RepID=A0A2G8LRV4_STIJA|nr:hypothetical protein BSL78_00069 [Apostichopus japonicus]